MGQVFTWDAIRCGHVPRLESFTEVADALRRELPDVPAITGAILCGSVARGDHSIRSDIDCFVLYDPVEQKAAFEYMQQAVASAAKLHVPLGFIPCDTLLAGTRMHHIGTSFARHLLKSAEAGGLLKGNPLAELAQSLPERDELEGYLRVKMYTLQEAWSIARTFSEERTALYLRKLLEAPLHVARKTVACVEPLEGDSKSYVQKRYKEIMPEELTRRLEYLIGKDQYYTTQFAKIPQNPNEQYYRWLLGYLLVESERVLEFIRLNLAFVAATAR